MERKMSKKNQEKLFVEIDEQLKQNLKEQSDKNKKSISQNVRDILDGYFKRQRHKKST